MSLPMRCRCGPSFIGRPFGEGLAWGYVTSREGRDGVAREYLDSVQSLRATLGGDFQVRNARVTWR